MNNRDIFDLAVGEIFGKCFEEFPVKIKISCLDIALAVAETYSEKEVLESNDLIEREAEVVFEAVDWLVKAEYLWVSTGDADLEYHGATLTPKGLQVLNSVPASLKEKVSLGKYLSKGVKTLGVLATTEAVKLGLEIGASNFSGA